MRGFLLVDLFVRATRKKKLAMTYVNVSQRRPAEEPSRDHDTIRAMDVVPRLTPKVSYWLRSMMAGNPSLPLGRAYYFREAGKKKDTEPWSEKTENMVFCKLHVETLRHAG